MADVDEADIQPSFDVPRDRELRPPSIAYDPVADAVTVYFFGPPEPAYSDPVDADPHVLLRVHLEEHYVVGMEIENFVRSYLPQHPEMLELARVAGVSESVIAGIEADVSDEQRKVALVNLLRGHFEELATYAD